MNNTRNDLGHFVLKGHHLSMRPTFFYQQWRAAKGLSRKELSQLANVSVNRISAYEKGTAEPDNATRFRLEQALGAQNPAPARNFLVIQGGERKDLPEDLVPLVMEMWKGGLDPCGWQQEAIPARPGFAMLKFRPPDLVKFLNIVGEESDNPEDMERRIIPMLGWSATWPRVGAWHYEVQVLSDFDVSGSDEDEAVKEHAAEIFEQGEALFLNVAIHVYFPRRDLLELVRRMIWFNRTYGANPDPYNAYRKAQLGLTE